jgi:hypothetical protein
MTLGSRLRASTVFERRGFLLASVAGLAGPALTACSADSVDEAPATLLTVGAFVARADDPDGLYRLYRVLYVLRIAPMPPTLFVTVYAVRTRTVDQAREAAQKGPLPLETPVVLVSEPQFAAVPHEIVWFRSLNAEERARVQ